VFSLEHGSLFERLHSSKGQGNLSPIFYVCLSFQFNVRKALEWKNRGLFVAKVTTWQWIAQATAGSTELNRTDSDKRKLSLRADQQPLFRFMYILKEEFGM
jgi:hypothetical protein